MAQTDDFWRDSKVMAKEYQKAGAGANVPLYPAIELVLRSGVLDAKPPLRILDNACGPGLVTELVYDRLPDSLKAQGNLHVLCGDIGPAMVERTKEKILEKGWKDVEARVLDQNDLASLEDERFTYVLTGLGINFCKNADETLEGIARILQPGGVNAFSTWAIVGWTSFVAEAFARVEGAPIFPTGDEAFNGFQNGNRWQDKAWVHSKTSRYFSKVEQYECNNTHKMAVQDFVAVFGGPMVKGLLGMFWSKEDQERYGDKLSPGLQEMFKEKGMETVDVQMDAIITVAHK